MRKALVKRGGQIIEVMVDENTFKKGGSNMIKRKDGSYSQRGLWDNIRANKGSGKQPTKQMLEQEKKIKRNKKQTGGEETYGNYMLPEFEVEENTGMYNPNIVGPSAPRYIPSETGFVPNPYYTTGSGSAESVPLEMFAAPIMRGASSLIGMIPPNVMTTLGVLGLEGCAPGKKCKGLDALPQRTKYKTSKRKKRRRQEGGEEDFYTPDTGIEQFAPDQSWYEGNPNASAPGNVVSWPSYPKGTGIPMSELPAQAMPQRISPSQDSFSFGTGRYPARPSNSITSLNNDYRRYQIDIPEDRRSFDLFNRMGQGFNNMGEAIGNGFDNLGDFFKRMKRNRRRARRGRRGNCKKGTLCPDFSIKQEGGEGSNQMEEILDQIEDALEQGAQPEEILLQLTEMGIDEQQAQMLIEEAKQDLLEDASENEEMRNGGGYLSKYRNLSMPNNYAKGGNFSNAYDPCPDGYYWDEDEGRCVPMAEGLPSRENIYSNPTILRDIERLNYKRAKEEYKQWYREQGKPKNMPDPYFTSPKDFVLPDKWKNKNYYPREGEWDEDSKKEFNKLFNPVQNEYEQKEKIKQKYLEGNPAIYPRYDEQWDYFKDGINRPKQFDYDEIPKDDPSQQYKMNEDELRDLRYEDWCPCFKMVPAKDPSREIAGQPAMEKVCIPCEQAMEMGGDVDMFGNGGSYRVYKTSERKGKTHKVVGPGGVTKYFGDPKLGERSKSKYGKKGFYARHKKNLAKNPFFRAYAKATWAEGGEPSFMQTPEFKTNSFVDLVRQEAESNAYKNIMDQAQEMYMQMGGAQDYGYVGNPYASMYQKNIDNLKAKGNVEGAVFNAANQVGLALEKGIKMAANVVAPGSGAIVDMAMDAQRPKSLTDPTSKGMSGEGMASMLKGVISDPEALTGFLARYGGSLPRFQGNIFGSEFDGFPNEIEGSFLDPNAPVGGGALPDLSWWDSSQNNPAIPKELDKSSSPYPSGNQTIPLPSPSKPKTQMPGGGIDWLGIGRDLLTAMGNRGKAKKAEAEMADMNAADNVFAAAENLNRGDFERNTGRLKPDQYIMGTTQGIPALARYGGNLRRAKQGGVQKDGVYMSYPTATPESVLYGEQPKKPSNTLQPVKREFANLEAEGGETAITPAGVDGVPKFWKIGGKRHSNGGTPLSLPDGSFIFSDTKSMKLGGDILVELGIKGNKKKTPAEISKVLGKGYEKFVMAIQDPNSDKIERRTAELMIENQIKKLGMLALAQEAKKGFPDGIPMIAIPYMESVGIAPEQVLPQPQMGMEELGNQQQMPQMSMQEMPMAQVGKEQRLRNLDNDTLLGPTLPTYEVTDRNPAQQVLSLFTGRGNVNQKEGEPTGYWDRVLENWSDIDFSSDWKPEGDDPRMYDALSKLIPGNSEGVLDYLGNMFTLPQKGMNYMLTGLYESPMTTVSRTSKLDEGEKLLGDLVTDPMIAPELYTALGKGIYSGISKGIQGALPYAGQAVAATLAAGKVAVDLTTELVKKYGPQILKIAGKYIGKVPPERLALIASRVSQAYTQAINNRTPVDLEELFNIEISKESKSQQSLTPNELNNLMRMNQIPRPNSVMVKSVQDTVPTVQDTVPVVAPSTTAPTQSKSKSSEKQVQKKPSLNIKVVSEEDKQYF